MVRRTLKFGPFLVGRLKSTNDDEYESCYGLVIKEKTTNIRINFYENDLVFEIMKKLNIQRLHDSYFRTYL